MNISADNTTPKFQPLALALTFAFCALLLLAHSYYYFPFIADDSLISLRYAERLIAGKGLTWNDGEYVEGYTNLLWVLATAGIGAFGVDLILAARIIGALSAITILISLWYYVNKTVSLRNKVAVLAFAELFIALSPPVAVWIIGGLENLMLAALLAAALPQLLIFLTNKEATNNRLYLAGFILGLLILTRADVPIIVIGCVLGLFICMPGGFYRRIHSALILTVLPLLFFAAQLTFRTWYYQEIFPNTYYAKFAINSERIFQGYSYIIRGLSSFLPLSLVVCILYLKKSQINVDNPTLSISAEQSFGRRTGLLAIIIICHGGFVILTGGDLFPAFRHCLIIIVLSAFIFIEVLEHIFCKTSKIAYSSYALLCCGLACGFCIAHFSQENIKATLERWEWTCKEIASEMNRKWAKDQPIVAVTAAGCLPFFSKLSAIDMYGMNDKYLARHHPPDFGHGIMGHELMNVPYVLSRRPDIITFQLASDNHIPREFKEHPEFEQNYTSYSFATPDFGPTGYVWLRNDVYKKMTGR